MAKNHMSKELFLGERGANASQLTSTDLVQALLDALRRVGADEFGAYLDHVFEFAFFLSGRANPSLPPPRVEQLPACMRRLLRSFCRIADDIGHYLTESQLARDEEAEAAPLVYTAEGDAGT